MNKFSFTDPVDLILVYFIVINLITFFIFLIDKSQSQISGRRISEKTLLLFTLIGGSPAALWAMNTFRHKTKKYSFQIPLYLIILLQISVIVWLLRYFSII